MKDLDATINRLRRMLLAECRGQCHWVGELSSSALSTATAVFALASVDRSTHAHCINSGIDWLARNQNPDGGWGDTTVSKSNLSTSLLVYSAMTVTSPDRDMLDACEKYIGDITGSLKPGDIVRAVLNAYGSDRTFSIPILTNCALAGRLGENGWSYVQGLPFELAMLPQTWFKWLRLPVVSYALPALIAIGQVGFHHQPRIGCIQQAFRTLARSHTLDVLTGIQPDNGGFLEAVPLTSFVVMSLAGCGQRDHIVTQKGTGFLLAGQRPDGSWPIDTNLATWVSTMAVQALGVDGLSGSHGRSFLTWLLNQQHRRVHPYTKADPGGWAWTDLPGGVPDADDTPGALLALKALDPEAGQSLEAVEAAVTWLLGLQNRDGGMPTFCRGWGKLPFDRSCSDLTAHALAAWSVWKPRMKPLRQRRVNRAIRKGLIFLCEAQNKDGSWMPLWFGNEHVKGMNNPVYGTARVLSHLCRMKAGELESIRDACGNALEWLLAAQQEGGGWGGDENAPVTIEETALAIDAIASCVVNGSIFERQRGSAGESLITGSRALMDLLSSHDTLPSSPIGLYFARLWYHEKLYPLIFSLSALRKVRKNINKIMEERYESTTR